MDLPFSVIETLPSKTLEEVDAMTAERHRLILVGARIAGLVGRDLNSLLPPDFKMLDEGLEMQTQGRLNFPAAFGADFSDQINQAYKFFASK